MFTHDIFMQKLNLTATLRMDRPKNEEGFTKKELLEKDDTLFPVRIRMTVLREVTYHAAGFIYAKINWRMARW